MNPPLGTHSSPCLSPYALVYFSSPSLSWIPPPVFPLSLRLRLDVVLNINQVICFSLLEKTIEAEVTNDTDLHSHVALSALSLSPVTAAFYQYAEGRDPHGQKKK